MTSFELICEKCKNATLNIIKIKKDQTIFKCSNCSNIAYIITSGVTITDNTHNSDDLTIPTEQLTLQLEDNQYGRVIPFPVNPVTIKEEHLNSLLEKEEKCRQQLTEIILTKDEAVWVGITSAIYIEKIKNFKNNLDKKNNSHLTLQDQTTILEKKQKFYDSIQNFVIEYISQNTEIKIIKPLTIDIIKLTENITDYPELSLTLDYINLEHLVDMVKSTIDSINKKEITNHLISKYLQGLESIYKQASPPYTDITRSIDMIWMEIGDILEAE